MAGKFVPTKCRVCIDPMGIGLPVALLVVAIIVLSAYLYYRIKHPTWSQLPQNCQTQGEQALDASAATYAQKWASSTARATALDAVAAMTSSASAAQYGCGPNTTTKCAVQGCTEFIPYICSAAGRANYCSNVPTDVARCGNMSAPPTVYPGVSCAALFA